MPCNYTFLFYSGLYPGNGVLCLPLEPSPPSDPPPRQVGDIVFASIVCVVVCVIPW